MNKLLIKSFICLSICFLLVSCANNNTNYTPDSSNEYIKRTINLSGNISTIYYESLENVQIKYDNSLIGTSENNGSFNIPFEIVDDDFSLTRLSFELEGYVFKSNVLYSGDNYYNFVVKANFEGCKESWADNFYKVGGKVVYHYDGETPFVGAKLFVDGNLVKIIQEDGNFDLDYVIKDSVITVEYDGYCFVDINGNAFSKTIDSDVEGLTFRGVISSEQS